MVTRHSLRFVIACDDDLSRAEEAIGSTDGPITIEAGLDSGTLLEMDEFRRLAAAASVSGANVSFASDDPLRSELARIAGLTVQAPESVTSSLRRALESSAPTRKIEPADIVSRPAPVREPIPTLTEALNEYTNHGSGESYASFSFVITPPIPRRTDQPAEEWYYDGSTLTAPPARRYRRTSPRIGKVAAFASVAAVALLLASSLILVGLLAPQATITLVPTTSAVNAEVTYGVAGTGGAYDVTIEPVQLTTTVTYSGTVPTTGTRTEPDGTASGTVRLTNPQTTEISLPAGTTIAGPDGITFTTVDDVLVPAADPFGTLTMGSATVSIVAGAAGPVGNVEAGVLAGQLGNGLFYSNQEATAGGTVKEIPVVAEADIQALKSQAEADLNSRAAGQIQGEVPAGFHPVVDSGSTEPAEFTFDHEVGADATELAVEASKAVSALAYDPDQLQEMARDELNQRLASSVPNDAVLLADTMNVGNPLELPNDSGTPGYRLTASARSRDLIDPGTLAELKRELVGASESDAASRLSQVEGVARFDLDYGPDWFPLDWSPRLESRIAIDVDDSPAAQTASGETRP